MTSLPPPSKRRTETEAKHSVGFPVGWPCEPRWTLGLRASHGVCLWKPELQPTDHRWHMSEMLAGGIRWRRTLRGIPASFTSWQSQGNRCCCSKETLQGTHGKGLRSGRSVKALHRVSRDWAGGPVAVLSIGKQWLVETFRLLDGIAGECQQCVQGWGMKGKPDSMNEWRNMRAICEWLFSLCWTCARVSVVVGESLRAVFHSWGGATTPWLCMPAAWDAAVAQVRSQQWHKATTSQARQLLLLVTKPQAMVICGVWGQSSEEGILELSARQPSGRAHRGCTRQLRCAWGSPAWQEAAWDGGCRRACWQCE